MQLQDKVDIRPILISVGLLLAPDVFQMVLDADNTSKGTVFSFYCHFVVSLIFFSFSVYVSPVAIIIMIGQ